MWATLFYPRFFKLSGIRILVFWWKLIVKQTGHMRACQKGDKRAENRTEFQSKLCRVSKQVGAEHAKDRAGADAKCNVSDISHDSS